MTPVEQIDQYIAGFSDWRGSTLAAARKAILAADPGIVEEWKWMGSPVWSRDGMIATGGGFKNKVKLTFSYGASLPDPEKLFNGNDTGATRRSIDLFEDDTVNEAALTELVRAAIVYNRTHLKKNASGRNKAGKSKDA